MAESINNPQSDEPKPSNFRFKATLVITAISGICMAILWPVFSFSIDADPLRGGGALMETALLASSICFSIGLIVSLLQFDKLRKRNENRSMGIIERAIYGGITGIAVALPISLFQDWHAEAKAKGNEVMCLSQLRSFGFVLNAYSEDWGGHIPPGDAVAMFNTMRNCNYVSASWLLVCPSSSNTPAAQDKPALQENVSYVYNGGGRKLSELPPDFIILRDRWENHIKYGNVLYASGKFRCVVGEEWQKLLDPSFKSSK